MSFVWTGKVPPEKIVLNSTVGGDFGGLTFSQNDMHQHLVECFERIKAAFCISTNLRCSNQER